MFDSHTHSSQCKLPCFRNLSSICQSLLKVPHPALVTVKLQDKKWNEKLTCQRRTSAERTAMVRQQQPKWHLTDCSIRIQTHTHTHTTVDPLWHFTVHTPSCTHSLCLPPHSQICFLLNSYFPQPWSSLKMISVALIQLYNIIYWHCEDIQARLHWLMQFGLFISNRDYTLICEIIPHYRLCFELLTHRCWEGLQLTSIIVCAWSFLTFLPHCTLEL